MSDVSGARYGRLAAALAAMADWLELDEVVVRPVGTLAAALART